MATEGTLWSERLPSIRSDFHDFTSPLTPTITSPQSNELITSPLHSLKMPSTEITFTLALPVSVTQLTAHMEAYRDTLPALNALRACNRFGKGPQCHVNKLPVELVQRIAHYCILPEREEKLEDWAARFRCYQENCRILDHFSREWLLENYYEWRGSNGCECGLECCENCDEPDDDQLEEMVIATDGFPTEEHDDRQEQWELDMKKFLRETGPLFQKHFGLDIWLSRVCLKTSWREDSTSTTVAYLIMRNRVEHTKTFDRHVTEEGYVESTYESGYGMTVAMGQQATPQDFQNFKRVMRILDLDVFIHSTQSPMKTLSLALSTDERQTPAGADATASFPRPMLLVRNKVE